jgi:hypothetical protein
VQESTNFYLRSPRFSFVCRLTRSFIQSYKRKIWDCVDPADRQRYLEKKQKKGQFVGHAVVADKENTLGFINVNSDTMGELPRELTKPQPIQQKTNSNRSNLEFQVNAMKVADLKKELRELGFDTGALKKDLRSRLFQAKLEMMDSSAVRSVPIAPQEKEVEISQFEMKSSTNGPLSLADQLKDNANDCRTEDMIHVDSIAENRPLVSDEILQKSHKDSFSSMQVEHHMTEISEVNHPAAPVLVNQHEPDSWHKLARLQPNLESKAAFPVVQSSKAPTTSTFLIQDETSTGKDARISDTEKPAANSIVSAKPQLQLSEEIIAMPVEAINEDDQNIDRTVSEASSATSKSSGKMVKDMVSKFSGLGSISSSSSNGSALSKGLQAKKEARLARMAEIREKVSSFDAFSLLQRPSFLRSHVRLRSFCILSSFL